jgi:hypothetical protein
MQDPTASQPERTLRVGPDKVTVRETEVVIEAKRPLADWEVHEHNAAPIFFENKKYLLVHKAKASPPFAVRYVLQPWPDGQSANAKIVLSYDAEAVAEREAAHRGDTADETIRMALLPFYPFLGLLWSGTQKKLTRFGFVPHSITGISCFAGFCIMFVQASFTSVNLNATLQSGKIMLGGLLRIFVGDDHLKLGPVSVPVMWIDVFILLAFIADTAVRYTAYLRESEWFGGFLEWLVPKAWRRNRDDAAE